MAVHFLFDERFVEAFAHTRHRVLGFRLRPFSLWHEFNLQLIDSPFLTGEPIHLKDLIAAVRICRSQYRSGGCTPGLGIPRDLRRRLKWWLRLWRCNLRMEVARFENYLRDYASPPKLWPNQHLDAKGGEGDRDFDELLEAVGLIWKETGCGEEYGWNMPKGAVHWYVSMFLKFAGEDVQIWTPIHDVLKKKNDEKRERLIAERTEALVKEGKPAEEAKAQATKEYWDRVRGFYRKQRTQKKAGAPAR